jgi:hypothetical protein
VVTDAPKPPAGGWVAGNLKLSWLDGARAVPDGLLLRAGFYKLSCPEFGLVNAWPVPDLTLPATSESPVSYLPGISMEKITSTPLLLVVFDANTTT